MTGTTRPNRTVLTLALVVLGVGAAIVAGQVYGRGTFFLVLASAALFAAIWLFWQSTHSLTGEASLSLEEALGLGAPSAEEERKQSVLRMLKDLEYERAVGKIAEEDFKELSQKYRAEAKALLANLDEELAPARKRIEARLLERMREARASSGSDGEVDKAERPTPSSGSDGEADGTQRASTDAAGAPLPTAVVPENEGAAGEPEPTPRGEGKT